MYLGGKKTNFLEYRDSISFIIHFLKCFIGLGQFLKCNMLSVNIY